MMLLRMRYRLKTTPEDLAGAMRMRCRLKTTPEDLGGHRPAFNPSSSNMLETNCWDMNMTRWPTETGILRDQGSVSAPTKPDVFCLRRRPNETKPDRRPPKEQRDS